MLCPGAGESRRLSCRDIEPLLPEFADGVLEDGLAGQVEEHLDECRACRGRLREEYAENALLEDALGANRLSRESRERLKHGILEELPRKVDHIYLTRPGHVRVGPIEFRLSFWIPLAAAAAAFLVAFVIRPVTVGRIADMAGEVMVRRAGDAEWTYAQTQSSLRAGDALRTEAFPARLALRDGTSLEIEPFSEIAIGGDRPGSRQVIELREGKLLAEVVRSRGSFRVETDYAMVSVVGTRFRTEVRRAGVSQVSVLALMVERGTVEVSNAMGACRASEGERLFVGIETDPALIGTDEAERSAGDAYKEILASIPSSMENALLARGAISKLGALMARYPNTRWADDAMWVLSLIHPIYALSVTGTPDISDSMQLCSEWVSRYGQIARLEEWTVSNFPSLLRGQAVASRSAMASSSGELSALMAIHKADIHLWSGRRLAATGEARKALEAYLEGLNVLQIRPQAAQWLVRLKEDVEGELRRSHTELRMRLERNSPQAEAQSSRLKSANGGI